MAAIVRRPSLRASIGPKAAPKLKYLCAPVEGDVPGGPAAGEALEAVARWSCKAIIGPSSPAMTRRPSGEVHGRVCARRAPVINAREVAYQRNKRIAIFKASPRK